MYILNKIIQLSYSEYKICTFIVSIDVMMHNQFPVIAELYILHVIFFFYLLVFLYVHISIDIRPFVLVAYILALVVYKIDCHLITLVLHVLENLTLRNRVLFAKL